MSKFGEPWTLKIYQDEFMGYTEILKADGYPFYDGYNKDPIEDDFAERVVACVNALAGVENVEPVKQLLDWMHLVSLRIQAGTIYQEELLEELDCFGFKIFGDDWKQGTEDAQ